MIEMAKKIAVLEENQNKMNKFVSKERKKLNIMDWLNTNVHPTGSFDDILKNISVKDSDITILLRDTFYELLKEILQHEKKEGRLKCVIAFEEKPDQFYTFKASGWELISRENLTKFFNKLHLIIYKCFCDWQEKQEKNERKDDAFLSRCDKITIDLMKIDFKSDSYFSKARSVLFQNCKQVITVSTEYELEFK
jgi:hypothetical protein